MVSANPRDESETIGGAFNLHKWREEERRMTERVCEREGESEREKYSKQNLDTFTHSVGDPRL